MTEDRRRKLSRYRDDPARPLAPPSPEERADRAGLDFPEALTLARKQANLSGPQLARRLGITPMGLWKLENAGLRPGRALLKKLFRELGPLPLGRYCNCPYCGQRLPESRKFRVSPD